MRRAGGVASNLSLRRLLVSRTHRLFRQSWTRNGGQGGKARSIGAHVQAQHIYDTTRNVPANPKDSRTPKLEKRGQEPKLAPIFPIKRKPYPTLIPSPLYKRSSLLTSMTIVNGPTKGGGPGLPHTANGSNFEDGHADEGGDARAP